VLIAIERSLEHDGQIREAIYLLSCLASAFFLIGRSREHQRVSSKAFEAWEERHAPFDANTPWMIIHHRIGQLVAQDRLADAMGLAAEFRGLTLEAGDLTGAAAALDAEGEIRCRVKDYDGAARVYEEATTLYKTTDRPRQALWLEAKIAKIELACGRDAEANQRKRTAYQVAIDIGDLNSEGMYAKEFAKIAMSKGDWGEARSFAERSVRAFGLAGETTTRFEARLVLAAIALGEGNRPGAAEIIDGAERDTPFADEPRMRDLEFLRNAAREESPPVALKDLLKIDSYD
jgi:tetratricopeptide (TPR) repeat protein